MTDPRPAADASLRWFGLTDRGKVRKQNEDAFIGLILDAHEVHHLGKVGDGTFRACDYVFAVSDGIGGANAGEFASRIAVEKIARVLPRFFKLSATGIGAGVEDVMSELYDQIHRALLFLGGSYEECSGMGATLSLCWFTPGWMHFGHIGDSRIYYLPAAGEGLTQLTHDDTHVGWLRRTGKINEREARSHPRKSVLQKALGAGHQFIEPQVGSVGYEKGDRFVICSDGVVDGLYDSQLAELVRSFPSGAPENPAERLVKTAVEQSGRDNTTAIIVEVG